MKTIKVKKLDIKEDSRGWFAEIVRQEDLENKEKGFGQMYITVAKPGQIKGKHYHTRKTEWFCVVKGLGLLILIDKTTNDRQEIKLGEDNMVAVQIPPGIWHAIANRDKNTDMYLLAYIDESFNPEDTDTFYEEL